MSKQEKILRGAKIRLYPDERQAEQFNDWRLKCMKLWNLLLGMQKAAYSGEKYRPELRWRQTLAEIAELNYNLAMEKREKKIAAGEKVGDLPKPPQTDLILPRRRSFGEPNLFIWENDLMKLMARLKKEPLTRWIGGIHSHAAQAICKDMCKCLRTMISERAKGVSGRKAGFPRFKKASAYSEGSVYFANTQIKIVDWQRRLIKFPLGVGTMKMGQFNHIPEGAKIMGGRIYRVGEKWWLSPQFEFNAPDPLPSTGGEAGVKVAAKAVYTIYDGRDTWQILSRQTPRRVRRREKLAARKMSRRPKRSGGFYEAADHVAQQHWRALNRRDDTLHKGSRRIVNKFDRITIDTMDVKSMMQGDVKKLRKYIRNAAMARALHMVEYKSEAAGRILDKTHVLFPSTQICSKCGTVNPQMKEGFRLLCCMTCGNKMQRQKNAAVNEYEQGKLAHKASKLVQD